MYRKIGALRDLKLAKEIKNHLEKKGFTGQISSTTDDGLIWIEAAPAEREMEAKILYAQYLGLLPKYDLERPAPRVKMGKTGPLTKFLLYGSILTFLLQLYFQYNFGEMIFENFFLYGTPGEAGLFASLHNFEWWRLFTPIFLHFGILHILFNSLALKDFGTALEFSEGWKYVLTLTIVTALFTNTLQYLLTGPMFGGMSGVVYAYFGHFLGRQMMKRPSVVKIPRQGIIYVVIWFFATFLPGPIQFMANGAHISGIMLGLLSGVGKFSWEKRKAWSLSVLAILAGAALLLTIEIYRLKAPLYFLKHS